MFHTLISASCANETRDTLFNRSPAENFLQYSVNRYTSRIQDGTNSVLNIAVSFRHSPQQVEWRYNNEVINAAEDSRASVHSEGLTVNGVQPSDAGNYEVIAVFSNELGCESAQFVVHVECE